MRIAIVHDYIKEYGGAERVLESLHKIFPHAPIYTTVYLPSYLGPHRTRFEKYDIRTSFLQFIPFKAKLISPLRLVSAFAFKSFDFSGYDVIIVSQTGAYFPNSLNKGSARLVTYTHTPPRYLYGYKTARDLTKNKFIYLFATIANHFLRMVDFKASQNVDKFIANSQEVKARIEKFYRREAIVIYPPVEINSKFKVKSLKLKKDYYLSGGRLARAKGIDIIIDAFIKNKKPLKVFGRGFAGYEKELKKRAGYSSSEADRHSGDEQREDTRIKEGSWSSQDDNRGSSRKRSNNIEFVGEVSDEKKFELMKNAKAFVFASYDEDFGITPVEAMGVGTPIIAFRSGGVKETVIDGKTGVFFDENTPEALNSAIEKFETLSLSKGEEMRNNCVERAQKFSAKEFDRRIKEIVENI